MNQTTRAESTSTPSPNSTSQSSPYIKPANPYARMSQRRAIACTTCAKAKTKCDKAVPSCSRCTAKGLHCEPRSTRRTSDNSYRKPTKHIVTPKRFGPSSAMPIIGASPRSVPTAGRHPLVRTVSQMDYRTAIKLGHQAPHYSQFNMLAPLPSFAPQIVDECYSYSSSPDHGMPAFSQPMEKTAFANASRSVTPQTPDSFAYREPFTTADSFNPYMDDQSYWSDDGSIPIGLGFEHDIPSILPGNSWSTPEPETITQGTLCNSPPAMAAWSLPSASVSPPQLAMGLPPHPDAVPSLSISECSVDDYASPEHVQEQWVNLQPNAGQAIVKPSANTSYINSMKAYPQAPAPIWEDVIVPRMQAY